MPTAGDKRIPEQGHADWAAEVVNELVEARGRSHRPGVSLLSLPIHINSVSFILLMIGRLLHLGPFVNHFCRRVAKANFQRPPV